MKAAWSLLGTNKAIKGDGSAVWIISELYYPEDNTTGAIMTSIAEGLAQDFEVKVLCGQPVYSARGIRGLASEERNGVSIRRCRSTTFQKDRLFLRTINWATLVSSIFSNALKSIRQNDVVIVVTQPPILPFVVAPVCWLRKAKCVLLIHDVYPDVLVAAGFIRHDGLVARMISRAAIALYRRMSRIVTLGRDMTELVVRKCPEAVDRTVMIPNWADQDLVKPAPKGQNRLLSELGLVDRFVVLWAGNIGRLHGIEEVVEAARALSESGIHFLFVGSGAKREWLESVVRDSGQTNVTIVPGRPRVEANDFLNACDVALVSLVGGMKGVAVPSRLYLTLASGKPLIAAVDSCSEVALVVEEEGVGWVVPPGDVTAIQSAIEDAASDPIRIAQMGINAEVAARDKYSFGRVRDQYVDLISELRCDGRS